MQTRDAEIIEYIRKVHYADTQTLAYLFFPSIQRAQTRLKELVLAKRLKRVSLGSRQGYAYMFPDTKVPLDLGKVILLSKLSLYFKYELGREVLRSEYDVKLITKKANTEPLECDAVFVTRDTTNTVEVFIVESTLSQQLVLEKIVRYENYSKYKEYLKTFPKGMPKLLFVTDCIIPKSNLEAYKLDREFTERVAILNAYNYKTKLCISES